METRKELTRQLIAAGFKELLQTRPFDKISIHMITDHAGIRRPSFYNHFLDKYDLLEWIAAEEVIAPAGRALAEGNGEEALIRLFSALLKDAPFYRRAFQVTGQNGFDEAFTRLVRDMILKAIPETLSSGLPAETAALLMAEYHAAGLTSLLRKAIQTDPLPDPEQLLKAYRWLLAGSLGREQTNT